jgi:parallel beta-helix repeat protein
MNLLFLGILIFLFNISSNAHDEFYKVQNGQLVLTNSYPFVHWQENQIRLLLQFNPATIPFELDYNETIDEFRNGYNEWAYSSCYSFTEFQFDGVPCNFSSLTTIFPDPEEGGAGAILAIEEIFGVDYIVEYAFNPRTAVSQTQVAFNNTNVRNFQWTNAIVFPPFTDWLHFKSVVVHEFGHMLGLNHCTQLEATMWPVIYFNTYDKATLSSYDITGVNILCGATGVEDYIFVWVDNPEIPFNINQLYVGRVHSTFVDLPPYGDYIVEWGNWRIKALTNCSEILALEDEYGNINIPPLPDGHYWLRDANGYVLAKAIHSGMDNTGHYHEGYTDIKISGVPDNSSGTLTSDGYWCGDVTITGNITVPSGITLTIYPGANINFNNSSSLIVNGTLNASGVSFSKITFDFINKDKTAQNGIKIYSGATANISHAIIKNAWNGIYANAVNPNISNCEIKYCDRGIYLYNTNSVSGSSSIINNKIFSNPYGIYLYKSSPQIRDNEIYTNGFEGILAHTNSSPYLGYYGVSANNVIYGNLWGIRAYYNSNPFLGEDECGIYGGYNIIQNNADYAIVAELLSNIMAEMNWWGSSSPSPGLFFTMDGSSIDYIPYLTSPPNQRTITKSPEEIEFDDTFSNFKGADDYLENPTPVNYDPNWPIERKLKFVRSLIYLGKNAFAQSVCKDIIRFNPDSLLSFFALDILWEGSRHPRTDSLTNINALRGFLNSIIQNGFNREIFAAAGLTLAGLQGTSGLNTLNDIIEHFSGHRIGEIALFQKFMYYLFDEEDRNNAILVLQDLVQLYPNSLSTKEALRFIDSTEISQRFYLGKNKNLTADDIPVEYELLGNFPNPFNPGTNIRYALPYESEIEIRIYDIMGREIISFDLTQTQGYHNLYWDGKNNNNGIVSSGIYIFRIKAKSLEGNNEVFEKSAKLMLLK